jgi:hypothetical protein
LRLRLRYYYGAAAAYASHSPVAAVDVGGGEPVDAQAQTRQAGAGGA